MRIEEKEIEREVIQYPLMTITFFLKLANKLYSIIRYSLHLLVECNPNLQFTLYVYIISSEC